MPTMACRAQLLRPGEHTKAHRHTGSAVYHVVKGVGMTIIDGKQFSWRKGDIVALPPWALHEHANSSAKDDAVLFSIQDAPVLIALGLFYEEEYGESDGRQKVASTFESK
jgi:gentisate 1,2-dioxygenase